ncbi:histidine phosphatase family protein [Shewanella sp. WXL01]|uniref:histidine phosphatase family protein n=1 Tax=Shewanella sp. WXL01 TaxID=2709721 RepID=UPI00143850D0|nr:histidine phosphatase family protein [Shewanella sp. WXL01]NKF51907.1 histidine phosphatase family protein [Shewanella sp. WXL01]
MSCIYLIRHGQASALSEDYDQLSPKGEQQAIALGEHLATSGFNASRLLAGTMKRHQQTASLTVNQLFAYRNKAKGQVQPPAITSIAELNELDHQNIIGQYDQRFHSAKAMIEHARGLANPKNFFLETFGLAISKWTQTTDNQGYSESWHQFYQRIKLAEQSLVELAQGQKNTLVFSSGGPISMLTCFALGLDPKQFLMVNQTLVNAGMTKFIIDSNGRLKLSSLNQHDFLERLPGKLVTYT